MFLKCPDEHECYSTIRKVSEQRNDDRSTSNLLHD